MSFGKNVDKACPEALNQLIYSDGGFFYFTSGSKFKGSAINVSCVIPHEIVHSGYAIKFIALKRYSSLGRHRRILGVVRFLHS